MRASSEASLQAAKERWNAVLETSDAVDTLKVELTHVVDAIDSSPGLRRALTDPARPGEDKAALVADVFGKSFSPDIVDLVSGMARARWSHADDLSTALERIGAETALASAERAGELDRLADELFQVFRLLGHERQLRNELTETDDSPERRLALLDAVFGKYLLPRTMQILGRTVTSTRHPSVTSSILETAQFAAERRDRLVAVVTAAVPLTDAQIARLEATLGRKYNKTVHINVAVDPQVVGGIRVHIGDDLVDNTVAKQVETIRRAFAD